MPRNIYDYEPLDDIQYEKKECCETCLTTYPVYKMKYDNRKVDCVVNDSREVVFYMPSTNETSIRIPYSDIKQIELRGWRELVLVLSNREVVLRGSNRKKMFSKLRECLMNQLL
jgi:hypothetical protein